MGFTLRHINSDCELRTGFNAELLLTCMKSSKEKEVVFRTSKYGNIFSIGSDILIAPIYVSDTFIKEKIKESSPFEYYLEISA